jgi:poly(glycerol-phosphate) alpha-glucosyltransferase
MNVTHLTNSVSLLAGGLYTSVRELALAQQPLVERVKVIAYWDARTEQDAEPWRRLAPTACKARLLGGVHFGDSVYQELDRQQPSLTHCHGIWLRSSADNHRWSRKNRRPYLIAPRGMLDPWAVRNSGWKKKIAGHWFEYAHLRDCPCLHALCEEEAQAFRLFGLKNPIAIIPNGIHLPPEQPTETPPPPWHGIAQAEGKNILLFIGRIHPKKGLPLLLDAFAQVRSQSPDLANRWSIVIAGYDQVGHLQELKTQAAQLGLADHVHFVGPVNGALKDAALRHAHAFTLPSYSEGLPMSVLEAWAYGLPVVMTPQCNLPSGFSSGAAVRVETNAVSVADGLRKLLEMAPAERRSMGDKGRALAASTFTWDKIAAQTVEVYRWLLDQAPAPDCITAHQL